MNLVKIATYAIFNKIYKFKKANVASASLSNFLTG